MTASNIADVAWAPQVGGALGAAAATSVHRLWLAGGDQPHLNMTKEDFVETTGARMRQDAYNSQADVAGSPEFFTMADSAGSLLAHVLGAETVTGASDPYTHTIVPANSVPRLTVWRNFLTTLSEKFPDCKVTHLKIHFESGKPLRITPTVMGVKGAFLTAQETTAAIEKTLRLLHYDGSGALLFEGAAVATISGGDIDIDNGGALEPGDSLMPNDVSEGVLSVIVSGLNMKVLDFALYNRLMYGSATPANNAVPTTAPLELAGSPAGLDFTWAKSASRSIEIKIPRVQVAPFVDQPNVDGSPLRRQITLQAYQPASGASITCVVKNSKSVHLI